MLSRYYIEGNSQTTHDAAILPWTLKKETHPYLTCPQNWNTIVAEHGQHLQPLFGLNVIMLCCV